MNIYGYSKDARKKLHELSEVSVQADAKELRRLARFIDHCASCIEKDSDKVTWEHEHIIDFFADHVGADVVVVRAK